jgi:histidine ammonia-lyase
MRDITVGTGPLAPSEILAAARGGAGVRLSADAENEMAAGRKVVEALADDVEPHYGISTGFGALAVRHIPVNRRAQLQRSLVRSHAAGSGPEVEREVVRALVLLRLSTLATGRTGVRPETARVYAAMLSAGITPVVHEYGSLGCSGDLAPLAHCALAAMGEGEVRDASGATCGLRSRPPRPRPPSGTGYAPTCPAPVRTGGWRPRSRPPWDSSPPARRSPPPSE